MAKKKNKGQNGGDSLESAMPPATIATPSTSKPKEVKPAQPSTSALIICRNKYVILRPMEMVSLRVHCSCYAFFMAGLRRPVNCAGHSYNARDLACSISL